MASGPSSPCATICRVAARKDSSPNPPMLLQSEACSVEVSITFQLLLACTCATHHKGQFMGCGASRQRVYTYVLCSILSAYMDGSFCETALAS